MYLFHYILQRQIARHAFAIKVTMVQNVSCQVVPQIYVYIIVHVRRWMDSSFANVNLAGVANSVNIHAAAVRHFLQS